MYVEFQKDKRISKRQKYKNNESVISALLLNSLGWLIGQSVLMLAMKSENNNLLVDDEDQKWEKHQEPRETDQSEVENREGSTGSRPIQIQ